MLPACLLGACRLCSCMFLSEMTSHKTSKSVQRALPNRHYFTKLHSGQMTFEIASRHNCSCYQRDRRRLLFPTKELPLCTEINLKFSCNTLFPKSFVYLTFLHFNITFFWLFWKKRKQRFFWRLSRRIVDVFHLGNDRRIVDVFQRDTPESSCEVDGKSCDF